MTDERGVSVEVSDVSTLEPVGVAPVDHNATALVRLALEQNRPVEVLERLVSLQERVADREARMSFVRALSAFRAKCPQPRKTKENSQFTVTRGGIKRPSMYAPLDEIERVARPVAADHGLVWTWDTSIDKDLMHVTCRVLHVDGHSENAVVSMPYASNAGASPQQKYAITQTYGMRYSLIAALGITASDEDTDGNVGETDLVTEEQAANLRALVTEVGADEARFLKWLKVAHYEAIPAKDIDRAVRELEKRRTET